jgi:amino acid permease
MPFILKEELPHLTKYCSGGPAGLIYSFIVVWGGDLATFASLAELASMYDC